MEISEGFWTLENGLTGCVCFRMPSTGGWYGVAEGEAQTMPRWWDKNGVDNRDKAFNLNTKQNGRRNNGFMHSS